MAKFVSLTTKVVATRAGHSFEFVRGVPLEIHDEPVIRADLQANGVVPVEEVDDAVLAALTQADKPAGKPAAKPAAKAAE